MKSHERWRLQESLNLAAAENRSSETSRHFLQTDLVNRYSNPKQINFHRGARFLDEIQGMAEELAKKVFDAKFADVRPVSGHLADMAVVMALAKSGDKILSVSAADGGYPGISEVGLGKFLGLKNVFFPFDKSRMNIKLEESKRLISEQKPRLIIFGASYILFPQPVSEIAASSNGAICVYDGSHVLGLIAGGEFQQPLKEGCSVLLGSTHKSFPGPQGGIIVSNDQTIFDSVAASMVPGIVDNIHLHRIASLAASLSEMLHYGRSYAKAVVRNARAMGKRLDQLGVKVKCGELGYSASHQVHLDYDAKQREDIADKLERASIIIDSGGRIGVAEVTRQGMGTNDVNQIAELVSDVILNKASLDSVRKRVRVIAREFRELAYTLE